MYPRIPSELVADPLGSALHTLGTAAQGHSDLITLCNQTPRQTDLPAAKSEFGITNYLSFSILQ